MNESIKENFILKINSEQQIKDMKIDQQIIQQLSIFMARFYSKKSIKSYSEVKNDLIIHLMIQGICDGREDDNTKKLRIFKLLDDNHSHGGDLQINETQNLTVDNIKAQQNSAINYNLATNYQIPTKIEDIKVIDKIKAQNAVLMNTNKELLEELDLFKNSHE